ncbi:MAG: DUF512 domain-containing protein [Oscillospiraceae bacterium]|nr:DUF512 domain-containing protein [Oscillospiraceae bacterium]
MVKITSVKKNSIAETCGIYPGDFLVAADDFEIDDILDYQFYLSESKINLTIKRGEEVFPVAVTKPQYADFGLVFESYMMDKKKSCGNNCIFCFVDQLPKNCLRSSLYFKDDDERLSFLHGNYITLTNLEDAHIDRIIKFKISPLNISVHTTNPELRVKMMQNPRAGEVLKYINTLNEHKIAVNAQIVLCKNINDNAELERTLQDLCALPSVLSIAVVPAGLTKFRDKNNLYKLESFDKSDCGNIIDLVNRFDRAYCADEFYLKANREVPCEDYYNGYPQYENGVGIIRSFREEFYAALAKMRVVCPGSPRKISVATGEAAYDLICGFAGELEKRCENLSCAVFKIKNRFFGEEITAAGLITGSDIKEQLAERELGDELLIPSVMLRHERDLFLDDVSVRDVERALRVKVTIVENNAEDFIAKVLGGDPEKNC